MIHHSAFQLSRPVGAGLPAMNRLAGVSLSRPRPLLPAVAALLMLLVIAPAQAAFTDNGDGTVSDSETGLMWDQCSWGQSGSDCSGGSASGHTWNEALNLAITANTANHKGYNDWRLPSRTELESLVDITTFNPAIDTTAFPNTPSSWYWSSTVYTPDPAYAWGVNFDYGYTYAGGQSYDVHVRLVRSGQSFDALAAAAPAPSGPATPVPALGPWGLALLGGLLGLFGLRSRRPI